MSRETLVLALWLLALSTGCAPVARVQKGKACLPRPENQPARPYGQSIVGGEPAPEGDRHSLSTVGLLLPIPHNGTLARVFVCTGVLVSSDLILTAAHCLKHVTPETEANPDLRIQIHFSPAIGSSTPAALRKNAQSFKRHEGYSGNGMNDLGWVRFQGGLPEGYAPVRVLTDIGRLTKGMPVTIVGYGATGTTAGDTIGTKRIATTFVEGIIDRTVEGTAFSHLLRLVDTSRTGRKGACFGDSGGPAFVTTASTLASLKVAGVTQGTIRGINAIPADRNQTCESGDSNYTLIAPFLPWIRETSGADLAPPPTPPRIVLDGLPEATSSEAQLSVKVKGEGDLVSYRFALVDAATECESASYSDFLPFSRVISEKVGQAGKKRLCVAGKDIEDAVTPITRHEWTYQVAYGGQFAPESGPGLGKRAEGSAQSGAEPSQKDEKCN